MTKLLKSMRQGFSLIEVNMAIFVLAGGVLALLGLFPLGLRDSLAARNEMRLAAFAERFIGAARIAASNPDVKDVNSLRTVLQSDFNFTLANDPGKNSDASASEDSISKVWYRGWVLTADTVLDGTGDKTAVEIGVQVTADNFKQNKRAFSSAPVYSVTLILDKKNSN